jgi:acetyl esterase/lipase
MMRPLAPVALDALTAEMRVVNEALARGANLSQWRAHRPPELPVDIRSIDVGGRDLTARVIIPPDVRAVYLETHGGGGWSGGSAAMCDVSNADLALACNVAVFAFDHRLAPAWPYPAAPDDCEAAALWLLEAASGNSASGPCSSEDVPPARTLPL